MSLSAPVPPLRTKICGITSIGDAELAISAGADAVGLNFFPGSKRHIDFVSTRAWIETLQGRVDRVAVVVNAAPAELAALRDSGCFEWIQFHGDESPAFCAQEGGPAWIKAIRVKEANCFEKALTYSTDYLLLDAWSEDGYGGTGTRLNWDVTREFVIEAPERRIILAGGLNPHNVRDAIRIVRPHAVDVASGVELEPRQKNEYLVREFISVARSA